MAAGLAGRPLAFHGAQVGVASVLAATIWHDTLDTWTPTTLTRDAAFPEPDAVERQVRAAFDPLDPSGRMADECWRDVSRKLDRWHAARASVDAFAADWDTPPDGLARARGDPGRAHPRAHRGPRAGANRRPGPARPGIRRSAGPSAPCP